MSIQFKEENGGRMLIVHVSDTLSESDYELFVSESIRLAKEHGRLKLLFDMSDDFKGWNDCSMWCDTRFADSSFSDIARLAMVGDKRWQHGMARFCKPFTKATIRYFNHDDAHSVRTWLEK